MPTGHYRFRRSLGNVSSRFRGARPDTYPLFTGVLDTYPGAAAAYSLRALTSGWLAGDVVEVRRDSDSTSQDFTASQITNGQMLDFVNGGTSDLYSDNYQYFNGVDTKATFTQETYSGDFYFEFNALSITGGRLFSGTGGSSARFLGGNLEITDTSATTASFPTAIYANEFNRYRLEKVGGLMRCYVNGTEVGSAQSFATFNLRDFGNFGGSWMNGILGDFDVNGINMYAFYGDTPFSDTIGSKNLTPSGSFAAYTGQPFNGFVSTWYDQSGNANDATQATTTEQPKIVDAGSLVTGGIDFDGVDDVLEMSNMFSGTTAVSQFIVGNADTTAISESMVAQGNTSGAAGGAWHITSEIAIRCSGNSTYDDDFVDANSLLLSTLLPASSTSADVDMFLNGIQLGQVGTTSTTMNLTISAATIGAGGLNHFDGRLNEIIAYNIDQSANRVGIEANINDFYSIY